MNGYNSINGVLIPIGQRYDDFIRDWRLWEDSPTSRLMALNQHSDKRFHLPEDFVEKYNPFILKDTPERERDYLTKVLGPRKQGEGEDNTNHALKHMAAIWVLTGNLERAHNYAKIESLHTTTDPSFRESDTYYFHEFADGYRQSHSPKINRSEEIDGLGMIPINDVLDISLEDEKNLISLNDMDIQLAEWNKKVDEYLKKNFPDYYPVYTAIQQQEASMVDPWDIHVSYLKRFAEIATASVDHFKNEALEWEKNGNGLTNKNYDNIRRLLEKSDVSPEHLAQYDQTVQELISGREKRELLASQKPNINGLFHSISEKLNQRGLP